jgi:copper(I)-binding protein
MSTCTLLCRAPAVVVATALLTAGCGGGSPAAVDGAAVVTGEVAGDQIEIRQAQLEPPPDGVHEEGTDVRLSAEITNQGTVEDDLLDVRGPDVTDAALTVDGQAVVIPLPPGEDVSVGAEGAPSIVLEGLRTSLGPAQSIPLTFVFEEAGEVTVDAVVADPAG